MVKLSSGLPGGSRRPIVIPKYRRRAASRLVRVPFWASVGERGPLETASARLSSRRVLRLACRICCNLVKDQACLRQPVAIATFCSFHSQCLRTLYASTMALISRSRQMVRLHVLCPWRSWSDTITPLPLRAVQVNGSGPHSTLPASSPVVFLRNTAPSKHSIRYLMEFLAS